MKIYFLVATQPDNLGDLLINKMLIDELSFYGDVYIDSEGLPDSFVKPLLLKENVIDFVSVYGGSLKRRSMFKIFTKVKSDFKFYFKSPGPYGGEGYSLKRNVKKMIMIYQFRTFFKSGLSLNAVGNDMIVATKLGVFLEKVSNRYFDKTLVRSKENLKMLSNLNFNNIGFIPDVAFLYTPISKNQKTKVYVSLRDLACDDYHQKNYNLLKESIPYFIEKKLEVVFFYQVESDRDYNLSLFEDFKRDGCTFKEEGLEYDQISDFYSKSSYVITNRLHVMILAMLHESMPLLILKDDHKTSKINRVLKDNQLDELMIDHFNDVKKNAENKEDLNVKIKNRVEENRILCKRKIQQLFS